MRQQSGTPPFGLSTIQPAFDRATWLAKTLFDAFDATIILVDGDVAWRSRGGDDLPPVHPALAAMIRAGEPFWIADTDGSDIMPSRPAMAHLGLRFCAGAPIRLDNGATPGALCVVDRNPRAHDAKLARALYKLAEGIADECNRLHAAEAALATAHELNRTRTLLSAFAAAAPVAFVITDAEMRVLKINAAWMRDFGWDDSATGQSLYEIDPGRFVKRAGAFARCLAGRTIVEEPERADKDGDARWMQAELAPWRDGEGAVGGLIITAHDVTKLMDAISRSERSEQALHLALEAADICVYDIDFVAQAQQIFGNPDTMFEPGRDYHDLAGHPLGFVDPRDRDAVRESLRSGIGNPSSGRFECRIDRNDGREIWVQVTGRSAWRESGEVARAIGAIQNITGRKAAEAALVEAKEQAEAANFAKSTFLAVMSHEIRTPLNGVLGMAQAMETGELSDAQRERLAIIRQSGESLLSILNDVLDLSKIEAGKVELEEVEFDIGELARGAHGAFSAVAQEKGLTFDLTISPPARGVYRGDSGRIRQILYNLISNALKFTERGGVYVRVHRRDGMLLLTVSDSGIGIRREQLPSLFNKFEQADASTTRRFGGTGLGLAICRQLTRLMGGDIEATSQEGEGTTFQVRLPLPRLADGAEHDASSPEALAPAEAEHPPLRVLAAEDNRVNQVVLSTLLQQVGVTPHLVDNGREALEAWEAGDWDVILMDVQMPEMDGPTAARRIRARERELGRPRTPILALTANVMSHQVAEYMAAGMDGFVSKPIEVSRLFAALEEALADPDADAPVAASA